VRQVEDGHYGHEKKLKTSGYLSSEGKSNGIPGRKRSKKKPGIKKKSPGVEGLVIWNVEAKCYS
jgi:hypothetical protein